MVQSFKLFRWIDFVTFGIIEGFVTSVYVYALLNGLYAQTSGFWGLTIVTACFWAIYGYTLILRKQYLSKITFITKHQIAVIANGFDVKQADVEAETDELIIKWNTACKFDKAADALVGLWVKFDTFPITDMANMGTLAGYTVGSSSVIGWKADLKDTAFQHELGHHVHHLFTGYWSNTECHKFMQANNLP